jgi:hypothetical protein
VLDGEAILQAMHPQPRGGEVDLVAPDRDRLAHPQPMTIHHQDQQAITNAVPTNLGSV